MSKEMSRSQLKKMLNDLKTANYLNDDSQRSVAESRSQELEDELRDTKKMVIALTEYILETGLR